MIFKCGNIGCRKRHFVRNQKCKSCKVLEKSVQANSLQSQGYTAPVLNDASHDGYIPGLTAVTLLSDNSNDYSSHNDFQKNTAIQNESHSNSKDNSYHHTSHSPSTDSYISSSSSSDSNSSSSDSYSSGYSSSDSSSSFSSSDW